MSKEKYYTKPKRMSGMLKSLFRNQSIFIWKSVKQTDQKANMLVSLSFYAWLTVIIVSIQFDTYLHFPIWLLLIPGILVLLCIIECLYTVRPNERFLKNVFNEEIYDEYPKSEFLNMYSFLPGSISISEKEKSVDAMIGDHSLQLGNLIRGHFVSNRYANHKFVHMDRAYNYFLWTISSMLILFIANVFLSDGHFHEHNDRLSYIPYDIENPNEVFILDKELREISGLTFNSVDKFLYTINDEKGTIFKLSTSNGNITSEIKFGRRGDYEGIEIIDNQFFINNSKGDIFICDMEGDETQIQSTVLNEKNNLEGIGLDPSDENLILACKGDVWNSKADKVLLKYDQQSNVLDSMPFLNIYIKDLQHFSDSIYQDVKMKNSIKRKLVDFAPSGVAINAESEDIYILSGRGSFLVIYNKNKSIKDIIHLNEIIIPQPEGICFDDENTLYISTEGQRTGKLLKYERL